MFRAVGDCCEPIPILPWVISNSFDTNYVINVLSIRPPGEAALEFVLATLTTEEETSRLEEEEEQSTGQLYSSSNLAVLQTDVLLDRYLGGQLKGTHSSRCGWLWLVQICRMKIATNALFVRSAGLKSAATSKQSSIGMW